MSRHSLFKPIAAVCSLLVLSGCGSDEGRLRELPSQDPLWGSFISFHTSGSISRRDKIRVVFTNDVVANERVGQTAASILRVEPAIEGSVTFASAHEILIVPERDLPPEEVYEVTLTRGDLMGIPEGLRRYRFLVQVMKQDFDVGVTGLSPDSDNEAGMVLRGTLVTADVEEADRIERIVSATYMNGTLDVEWQHDADGRHHEFAIAGITRQSVNQELELTWDGEPIDVAKDERRVVGVPALNAFTVTKVDALQGDRQYVVVQFSDSIDTRQNLAGLVRLGEVAFTTSLEGNTLRIIPQQQLAGRVTVTVEPGIRSSRGNRLENGVEQVVTFASNKPGVRFAGRGVVLPDNDVLRVPFEAVNVRSAQVTAFRIYERNLGQFLQANRLSGDRELGRVGRYLWRRTLRLSALEVNKWNRYDIDVTDLMRDYPEGMFRLTLSINRGNSSYNCTEEENRIIPTEEAPPISVDDYNERQASSWDYAETYFNTLNDNSTFRDRNDPCKDAYYRYAASVSASRNFLASNIGIIVKRDQRGAMLIVTTDLRTAEPLPGVAVTFMNFQDELIGEVTTDGTGIGELSVDGIPFYALARKGDDRVYLKLSRGTALATSHFDVGGAAVTAGLKGRIYGERGVWRPGDDIHLTFVVEDQNSQIPGDHPVNMRLFNPRGQLIQSAVNSTPTNGFYTFTIATADDAPTGNWMARADIGGSTFTKAVRVEAVIPNRLRIELDFGGGDTLNSDVRLRGNLFGQWLNGAIAGNLNADVQARLTPLTTRFGRFSDFNFDDPAREFESEPQVLFDGRLDASGRASFETTLVPAAAAPGMLTAHFSTRVFERGGAFSTNRKTYTYSPYSQYVGVKLPPGDATRGMLLTDTTHTVQIGTLSSDGDPVSIGRIDVALYKIGWKWWWDRSGESLARYASSTHRSIVARGEVNTVAGLGTWEFEIKFPAWGRYLLRACDPTGGHCAGKIVYIDWPGWAGRQQEESGAGANVLTFFSDKQEYTVGEIAQIQLPDVTQGRALMTVENGTEILEQRWIEFSEGRTRFEVPITAAMSPNVYVAVTLIQPHAGRQNDRPIRLYGVMPLTVTDPNTNLNPVITAPDEWRPESRATIEVSEANGRRMTYTLAVVDEGLLGLTSFQTPDLHRHFYQKEALGVTTWDIYDDVVGAYGGELERLLALGGSGEAEADVVEEEQSRFPPVVRFLGPFTLSSGDRNTHEITLPEYIGAVRVMVVAGEGGAYGSASKSVFVREPLSLLATLPRVIGPDEELTVPVSLFVMDSSIRDVTLEVETDDHFEVVGSASTSVSFDGPGEKLAFLRLKVGSQLGQGRIHFTARSPQHTTDSEIFIDVRSPNPLMVTQIQREIAPGETWTETVVPYGLSGTNAFSLELTTLPPVNLDRRLQYLIRYPHGCVEQITSAVFPQLYLPSLVRLEPSARDSIQQNVRAGIERLRGFQVPTGGFVYWPGGFVVGGAFDGRNSWATNYVGHFLVDAEKLGYFVPPEMMADWINFQKMTAQSWSQNGDGSALDQAYRLYTLALAGRPEMGAMNRLREAADLPPVATWQLAAAYHLGGLPDIATDLVQGLSLEMPEYDQPGPSLGSRLRDQAIALTSLVTMDRRGDAQTMAQSVSGALFEDRWHSTHSVAYALLAMSKYYGTNAVGRDFTFEQRIGDGNAERITSTSLIHRAELPDFPADGQTVEINNTSGVPLYGTIVLQGIPSAGQEVATSSGLQMQVSYTDMDRRAVDVGELTQGGDFISHVTVRNTTGISFDNLVLEQMVPSGWEIHNPRLDGDRLGTLPDIDYQDIRDDRVYTYFALKARESKTFAVLFNAAYLGRYYLPSVSVEAMYDATQQARTVGRWVQVVGQNP